MSTPPFWIRGAPLGRLATSPQPVPHQRLREDLAAWKDQGADIVVSLLGDGEMLINGLADEEALCRDLGLEFHRFPITDHGLPDSEDAFVELIERLHAQLQRNRAVVVHCFAGIGRSTLVAAALLVRAGLALPEALELISDARGITVPDTSAQHRWLEALEARLRPPS
ncbi:MAG: dual specificity protein phosphatase family protein [Planctomycetota bacterium]|jgi:protein-tyrosine phosphatase